MAEQSIEQTKACAKCGAIKSLQCFYPKQSEPDGRSLNCRSCRPMPQIPITTRFWSKVDTRWGQGPKNNCWQWTGAKNREGYGSIGTGSGSKTMPAHKLSYILAFGPIPKGLCVLHECDNPPCVRPLHLFLGTKKANYDDMVQKGRQSDEFVSQQGHSAILTAEIVREARRLHASGAATQSELAKRFGVALVTMQQAISGRYWKHVD